MAEKAAKPKPKVEQELFHIHNLVRRVETRLDRAVSPTRHRMNILLGGGLIRIVRGRHAVVTRSTLVRLLNELVQKETAGMIKVTTPAGVRIDLATLGASGVAKKSAPRPKPPLDAAARDQSFEHGVGENLPTVPGGKPVTTAVPKPQVLASAMPEGEVEVEAEVEAVEELDEVDVVPEKKEEKKAEKKEAKEAKSSKEFSKGSSKKRW